MNDYSREDLTGATKSIIGRLSRLDTFAHSIGSDTASEVDAVMYLRSVLQPKHYIPPAGGWAAQYKTIAYLVAHILEAEKVGAIVELGSGVSTVWMGLALKTRGEGHLTSLEHDEVYATRTAALVRRHELGDVVSLLSVPLGPVETSAGPVTWYQLGRADLGASTVSMVFIDGPPATTDPLIRQPATQVLAPWLGDQTLIVLDDVDREGERNIVEEWTSQDGNASGGVLHEIETIGRSVALRFTSGKR